MSWFKRTKDPLVTDDYLQTAETVSRPMAIVYTIVMVFVVGALAFSLFFGGRWLYQNLDGSDQKQPTVVTNPITTTPPTAETSTSGTPSTATGSNTAVSTTNNKPQTTTTPTTTAGSSTTTTTSTSSNSQTAARPVAETIPATGPAETVSLFVITAVLSMAAYQFYIRKRLQ